MERAENISDIEDEPFVDSNSEYVQVSSNEFLTPSTSKKKGGKIPTKFELHENLLSSDSSSESSEENGNTPIPNIPIIKLDQWRVMAEKPSTVLANLDLPSLMFSSNCSLKTFFYESLKKTTKERRFYNPKRKKLFKKLISMK